MNYAALYYPWMHFQSDTWLKLALLTWDTVVRVRPQDLDDRDNDLVRQVRAETNFIVEMEPSAADLAEVAESFQGVLETYREKFVNRYGLDRADHWSDDLRYQPPESNIYFPDEQLFWIYCGPRGARMTETLRDILVGDRLARQKSGDQPWVGVAPRLGSVYMATLTDVIARHNSLSPVTDDPRMHQAFGARDHLAQLLFDEAAISHAVEEPGGAYIHVALNAVLEPTQLADVPPSTLLAFRERYRPELQAFREHVSSLAEELRQVASVENPAVAQARLKALYDNTTRPQLDELRGAMRGFGIESVAGALALKVDLTAASTTALGLAALGVGLPILAPVAIALSVVPYAASRFRERRRIQTTSPVAYLLAADRALTPSELVRR